MRRRAFKPPPPEKPLIERAFELARSGKFASFENIMRTMFAEGYSKIDPEWNGRTFRNQAREKIRKATIDV